MTKKKKGKTARQRRKQRQREEELNKEEVLELTDDPMADVEAEKEGDGTSAPDGFLEEDTEDFLKTFTDAGDPRIFSLDELEVANETVAVEEKVADLHEDAETVFENVVEAPELDPIDKAEAIIQLGFDVKERTEALMSIAKVVEPEFDAETEEFLAFAHQFGRKQTFTEKLKSVVFGSVDEKTAMQHALYEASQSEQDGETMLQMQADAKELGIGQPSDDFANALVITKDVNDDWRYVAWASNNFKDRDGEILTEGAHQEFADFLDANHKAAPVFQSWHTPGTGRKNPVDSWLYKNGFMIYSGKLEDAEAKSLLRVMQKTKLGMSHGFIPLERDAINPNLITKYRTFEISDLPLHKAANVYTDLEVIVKEVFSMEKANYLKTVLPEDQYNALMADTELAQKILVDQGVESKEAEEATVKVEVPVDLVEELKKELGMDELNEYLKQIVETNKQLTEKTEVQEEIILDLSASKAATEDEKAEELADMIAPKAYVWMQDRPSQAKETELKEDDKEDAELLKAAPHIDENNWFSNAFGVAPVKEQV